MTLQTGGVELNSGLLSPHPWLPVNIYCLQEGCLCETTEVLFPRSERELFWITAGELQLILVMHGS